MLRGGDPENGKSLSQTCAACHSVDGNSVNPVWPKLAGQHATYIVKQLNDFKKGNRVNAQMTAMVAPLSDQDMLDLGAYFASQKTTLGTAEPELIETGELIYRAGDYTTGVPACMACHGLMALVTQLLCIPPYVASMLNILLSNLKCSRLKIVVTTLII